jgi:hypothetical protein
MDTLNKINVRRLIHKLKKDIQTVLDNHHWEPNDSIKKDSIKSITTEYLNQMASRQAIQDFKVICDDSNNPPYNPEESLLQKLTGAPDNYLIESDENEYRLFYCDVLYRVLNKKNGVITSYFEEEPPGLVWSNSLHVDILVKPQMPIEQVVLNFKID